MVFDYDIIRLLLSPLVGCWVRGSPSYVPFIASVLALFVFDRVLIYTHQVIQSATWKQLSKSRGYGKRSSLCKDIVSGTHASQANVGKQQSYQESRDG